MCLKHPLVHLIILNFLKAKLMSLTDGLEVLGSAGTATAGAKVAQRLIGLVNLSQQPIKYEVRQNIIFRNKLPNPYLNQQLMILTTML